MDKLIDKLLEVLRKQVNQNNEEIRFNQDEINRLLSETINPDKRKNLDDKYLLNKELLDENTDFINFQLFISEFVEKYGHIFESLDEIEEDQDSPGETENDENLRYFKQTIAGKINFDQNHPQFNNYEFFIRLLKYYEEKEDYEMCDRLMKMIKSH